MATLSRPAEVVERPQNRYRRRAQKDQQEQQTLVNPNKNNKNIHPTAVAAGTATGTANDANGLGAKHTDISTKQIRTRNSQNITQLPSPPRKKRPLNPIANNSDPVAAKRSRISVEIISRSIPRTSPPKSIAVKSHQLPNNQPSTTVATALPPPPKQRQELPKTATKSEPTLKNHKKKAINGIKHELDKLQPSAADTSSATERPGRKLRSQEATRFKSELSAYFPDYDEVIGNDPKEQHVLNLDTPIILVDTNPSLNPLSQPPIPVPNSVPGPHHHHTVRTFDDNVFWHNQHKSKLHDFSDFRKNYVLEDIVDPLTDSYFASAHKKAERLEKSIRNTEKGRAQHEKDQIIRLLNELQGHDWLRTMGVSGVTESRKKTFEPARDHFIKGCQAILEKFRTWSQEEKKRKRKKNRALVEEAEEEEADDNDNDDADNDQPSNEGQEPGEDDGDDQEMADAEPEDEDDNSDAVSDGDPPEYSDVDASARQLHAEALARYTTSTSKKSRGEPPPKSPETRAAKEFTSFFVKEHQRDAALSKSRRRQRTVYAWGQPLPGMDSKDFDLPDEYRDSEILKAHARQKRRERRHRQA
ncbi:something about silencing, SAS, complex subunit 4-domain-containing protein [Hypoxylon sp. NC1633]|nr:something about silencing, SAS, complex subunit 4-domain-containing protein [Hypoxylon sp. NC1633]